jgi:hypothetical protein
VEALPAQMLLRKQVNQTMNKKALACCVVFLKGDKAALRINRT